MARQAVKRDRDPDGGTTVTGKVDSEPLSVDHDVAPADDSDLPDYLLRKGDAISGQIDVLQQRRIVEALLFAAADPLSTQELAEALPNGADVDSLLHDLQADYVARGVNLVQVAGRWQLRTAEDLSFLLRKEVVEQKRLSKAALETLAIIAYHQPVTRAEIEEVRGVATAKGTLDTLMEIGWIRMRGRRRTPGRPVTYGTTPDFLEHFGLNEIGDLPGMAELKGAGLLSGNLPADMFIPSPSDDDALRDDEDPIDADDVEPELEMHLPEDDQSHDTDSDDEGIGPADALNMDLPEVLDDEA